MVSVLENTRIGIRITIAVLLPVAGMLVFSGMELMDKRTTVREMDRLQELAELAPTVSALVHELQKERGTSAVFIGSGGTKFVEQLPNQWKATTVKRDALSSALDTFEINAFGVELSEKVEAATVALSNLAAVRKTVHDRSATVPKMASYYTPTIARLLSWPALSKWSNVNVSA